MTTVLIVDDHPRFLETLRLDADVWQPALDSLAGLAQFIAHLQQDPYEL